MATINDGGPAFPVPNDANMNEQEGMTLRDYMAASALPMIYSNYWTEARERDIAVPPDWRMGLALESYKQADAMIAARGAS